MCRIVLAGIAIALSACRAPGVGQPPRVMVTPLFGPVVSSELIAGEQEDGDDILLLVGQADLVRLNLTARRSSRASIQLPPPGSDQCWGLGRLRDGSLWTLSGRHTVLQFNSEGHVLARVPLADAHLGLFGGDDKLLLQRVDFGPPAPALDAMRPPAADRTPWSGIRTRAFPGLARASVAALNMISCGISRGPERPCWFPDQPAVWLVGAQGQTRRVDLIGLDGVSPEALLASDNPERPVRDAYVDADDVIWILSSGKSESPAPAGPGGWLLAAYGADGSPRGLARLPEPARLILRVQGGRVTLLTGRGDVAEVRPW